MKTMSGRGETKSGRVETRKGRESWAVMLPVLFGLTLLFLLSFFNRFAGLRSGDGEYVSGVMFLHGLIPYRDYFSPGPPLNVLKSAILLKTFGSALIVSRIAGVAERLVIAFVLFRWLIQLFRPWHALVASVVTIIISSGDLSDPIASYNHDAILLAMIAGLLASLALEGGHTVEGSLPLKTGLARRTIWLGFLSGVAAALSLTAKQTVGLGAIACVGLAMTILLAKLDGARRAAVWCASFAAGCAIPLAILTFWLWRNHILLTFLQMLFVTGPTAKATHPYDFLTRELTVAFLPPTWILPGAAGLALSWRAIRRGLREKDLRVASFKEQMIWIAAAVLLIGTAEALVFTRIPVLHDFSKSSVYYVLLGLTLWLAGQMKWLFRSGITRREAQATLFAAVAWSIAVMLSLSWPAFEPMTLPGLGFLLAATLDGVQARFRWFLLFAMAVMVFLQVREKLDRPFGFGHLDEASVRFATATSDQPQLRGIRMPPEMVRFLDDTVSLAAKKAQPGDTIFTYPEMGILYALTGRQPPTWALSHNIDVIDDAFARKEAQRLSRSRPALIVYYPLPEKVLRNEEKVWRGGRRSGQRDLIAAVEGLVASYRLAGSYVVAPGDPPIDVYVRR